MYKEPVSYKKQFSNYFSAEERPCFPMSAVHRDITLEPKIIKQHEKRLKHKKTEIQNPMKQRVSEIIEYLSNPQEYIEKKKQEQIKEAMHAESIHNSEFEDTQSQYGEYTSIRKPKLITLDMRTEDDLNSYFGYAPAEVVAGDVHVVKRLNTVARSRALRARIQKQHEEINDTLRSTSIKHPMRRRHRELGRGGSYGFELAELPTRNDIDLTDEELIEFVWKQGL